MTFLILPRLRGTLSGSTFLIFSQMNPSSSESREFVVGTSGHIDHGKTALVKTLTGVDADRFEEEKQRGITIDLGFAPYEDESGPRLGFVDVP